MQEQSSRFGPSVSHKEQRVFFINGLATIHETTLPNYLYEVVEPVLPAVIAVAELDSDTLTRHRAGHFIGEVMLGKTVESSEVFRHEKPIESLRDGIQWAAEGDEDGRNLVETNVATDVIERTLKAGHVMTPVKLKATPDGKFIQYNQTTDAIYANSLQLAAGNETMRDRTEAETRNKFRIEDIYRAGYFEDYNLVVFSLADDLPDVFFTETMSCSIQVLSATEDGLQLESAFVAGVAESEAERHDLRTIAAVGDKLNVDFSSKTPAQIIDHPVLVHKDLMPDGVINMVELWDAAAGDDTFFGETKPAPCSYQDYLELCHERTATFQPKIEIIRDQLIAEAPNIKTRMQAVERLHELSEQQMVHKAIEDHTIDPRVFGPEAAGHVIMARWYEEQGQTELATQQTTKAVQTADSKSCPWVKKQNEAEDGGDSKDAAHGPDEDEFGPLTFKCTNGHFNRRPRGKLIPQCRVTTCKNSVAC